MGVKGRVTVPTTEATHITSHSGISQMHIDGTNGPFIFDNRIGEYSKFLSLTTPYGNRSAARLKFRVVAVDTAANMFVTVNLLGRKTSIGRAIEGNMNSVNH